MLDTIKELTRLSNDMWGDIRRLEMNEKRNPDTLSYQDVESSALALEAAVKRVDKIVAQFYAGNPVEPPKNLSRPIQTALRYEKQRQQFKFRYWVDLYQLFS